MQRVTITRTEVKNGGTPEKPWKKLGIQTKEHGDKWLGAFYNKYNEKQLEALKEGVSTDIMVETSPDGKYLNFSMPTKLDRLEVRVARLEDAAGLSDKGNTNAPMDDINPDDIPF